MWKARMPPRKKEDLLMSRRTATVVRVGQAGKEREEEEEEESGENLPIHDATPERANESD